MKVLTIEDDPQIFEAIKLAFQIRWPEAKVLNTPRGEKGIEMVEYEKPDIVLLDLGLPDISGFEVLKRIRQFSSVPIIILTVMGDEIDKVKGLEWGADDYVTKPFRQLELMARIKALLRRYYPSGFDEPIVCGNMRYEPVTNQLTYRNRTINLTRTEGLIMQHLMRNAGHVVTHDSLAEAIWGATYPDATQNLKVHIRRLREKVEEDPANPRLIITNTGIGYSLAKELL